MLSSAYPVRALLIAIFVLMAGSGFLSTLIAIRLELAGASAGVIGLVGTSYFGGIMLGSLRVQKVIERTGHIRAFAAFVPISAGHIADFFNTLFVAGDCHEEPCHFALFVFRNPRAAVPTGVRKPSP